MKVRLLPFNLGIYLALCAVFALTYFIFDRPIEDIVRLTESSSLLGSLSGVKAKDFKNTRSKEALLKAYQDLHQEPHYCYTPTRLAPGSATPIPKTLPPALVTTNGADLRDVFWKVKVPGLKAEDCQFTPEITKQFVASGISSSTLNPLLEKQWRAIAQKLRSGPHLMEVEIETKHAHQAFKLFTTNVPGGLLVLLDGIPLSYFSDSERTLPGADIYLERAARYTLSIVINGRGFNTAFISGSLFAGLAPIDTTVWALSGRDSPLSTHRQSLILLLGLFSAILMLSAVFQTEDQVRTSAFAIVILATAINYSLLLYGVQASLSEVWIRNFRYLTLLCFGNCAIPLLGGLIGDFWRAWNELPFFKNETSSYKTGLSPSERTWAMGTTLLFVNTPILFAWINSFYNLTPTPITQAYMLIQWLLVVVAMVGAILTTFSLPLFLARPWIREDLKAQAFTQALLSSLVGGIGTLIYAASNRDFVSTISIFGSMSTTKAYFESILFPAIVGVSVLLLIGHNLRYLKVIQKLIPPSTAEMAKYGDPSGVSLDRTATEFGWLLLNDVAGSTGLKLTSLARVTHLLQSVFHKIHNDYFKDSMAFYNSLGDAMLIAIRTAKNPVAGDPILDKLIRVYTLYKDGIEHFKQSEQVISARLSIENEELHLALQDQNRRRTEKNISVSQLGFRTILTLDYYFYGLNASLSNIDSKGIYIVSKTEKLLQPSPESAAGGFYVFPDLMFILGAAIPDLEQYFEKCFVDKSKSLPILQRFLPDHVYRFDDKQAQSFEKLMEELTKEPLRMRSYQGRSLLTLSDAAQKLIQEIGGIQELSPLIELTHRARPQLRNFREKNAVIAAICDRACELGLWKTPASAPLLQEAVDAIGLPSLNLLEAISKRDSKLEPTSLLQDLKSSNPIRRNTALRFLPLARVANPFRPSAMSAEALLREASPIYLNAIDRFSIEAHLYFWRYLNLEPQRLSIFIQEIGSEGLSQIVTALEQLQIPSLHMLATHYRRLGTSLANTQNAPQNKIDKAS